MHMKVQSLAEGVGLEELSHAAQHLGRVRRFGGELQTARLDAGEVDHVVEQLRQHPPAIAGLLEQVATFLRKVLLLQQVQNA